MRIPKSKYPQSSLRGKIGPKVVIVTLTIGMTSLLGMGIASACGGGGEAPKTGAPAATTNEGGGGAPGSDAIDKTQKPPHRMKRPTGNMKTGTAKTTGEGSNTATRPQTNTGSGTGTAKTNTGSTGTASTPTASGFRRQ